MTMEESEHKLRRSRRHRIVAGVCGGLGEFFGLSPWIFRIIFLILLLPGGLPGLLPYILLWIIVPSE
jgi:phage shock protein C